MATQDLRSMLDRVRSIRHACDLDLRLFFHRHPCALLTGEQLVAYPGGGLLASLLKIAGTREGRQDVIRLLPPGPDRAPAAGLPRRGRLTKVA